jgi:hypothetical protein
VRLFFQIFKRGGERRTQYVVIKFKVFILSEKDLDEISVKRLRSELVNNMGNYSSLVNEKQFTKRVPTPKPEVNKPLLNSLVKIEQLLLETVRFLDNCPLRGEQWVNEQIEVF